MTDVPMKHPDQTTHGPRIVDLHKDHPFIFLFFAVVGFIILVSILVHGVTAAPLLQRLARRRQAAAG